MLVSNSIKLERNLSYTVKAMIIIISPQTTPGALLGLVCLSMHLLYLFDRGRFCTAYAFETDLLYNSKYASTLCYVCDSLVGVTSMYKCKIGLTQDSANFLHEIRTYASHKTKKEARKKY